MNRNQTGIARGEGVQLGMGNGVNGINTYKLPVIRSINSGDIMYNTMSIVNDTILCIRKFLQLFLLFEVRRFLSRPPYSHFPVLG